MQPYAFMTIVVALLLTGCRTTQGVSETSVDQEMTQRPAPVSQPAGAVQEQPRPNFDQESPKSQTP